MNERANQILASYHRLEQDNPQVRIIFSETELIGIARQDMALAQALIDHLVIALPELHYLCIYTQKQYWAIAYCLISREYLRMGPTAEVSSYSKLLELFRNYINKIHTYFFQPELNEIIYSTGKKIVLNLNSQENSPVTVSNALDEYADKIKTGYTQKRFMDDLLVEICEDEYYYMHTQKAPQEHMLKPHIP